MLSIYFTIIPVNSGFTDQLHQFISFYKLGLDLNYKYLHTPFVNTRSSQKIYELLGIDLLFSKFPQLSEFIEGLKEFQTIELNLNAEVLKENNIKNFSELRNYIVSLVEKEIKQKKNQTILVKFISPKDRNLVFMIHNHLTRIPDSLNFYTAYHKTKIKNHYESTFDDSSNLKILVHIRKGDTITSKFDQNIRLKHYYMFLINFFEILSEQSYSCCIFSDGYSRAFLKFINFFDFLPAFLFKKSLLELFKKILLFLANSYDKFKFNSFKSLPMTQVIVGEGDSKLISLIDAALSADIIIIGTRQNMIPKLFWIYGNRKKENEPICITLHKTPNLPYPNHFTLNPENNNHLIFFHVMENNYDELITKISQLQEERGMKI